MLMSVEGVYRDGKVELLQLPTDIQQARVIVTILPAEGPIDLAARGINEEEAAELRWRFGAGAADWDDPAMDIYNDYPAR
jgi:hypothetical protein